MTMMVLDQAQLAWGDKPLLDGVCLTIKAGDRFGLIGRNGTGKSSLLQVLAGEEQLDSGVRKVQNGLRIGYVPQEPKFPEASTLVESLELKAGLAKSESDDKKRWLMRAKICEYLHRFGLDENADPFMASGGEKKKAALALAFSFEPDLLLLDEPTNHLDIDSILLLEQLLLEEFKKSRALVVVTHDRAFLNTVSNGIIELDRGILRSYPGSFEEYQKRKEDELYSENKAREEFDKVWAQEEAWIRRGIEARRTRNEGRVRRLEKMRLEREARRDRLGKAKIQLDAGARSGKLVAELFGVTHGYGEKTLIRDLDFRLMRGDKLGLLGQNGVGKSTLIKIILGQIQPQKGKVNLGTNLNIAYFDQLREELDENKTLLETVSPGSDWVEVAGVKKHSIGYLSDFLFPPHRVNVKVSSLSGGEKNRLLLAKLFARPANLIVMDEPTNDLDIESLELLEETLANYPGTVILVSHDRDFMDNVASITIGPDENGTWTAYSGGYAQWLEERQRKAKNKQEVDAAKDKTTRIKPKRENKGLSYKEARMLEALPGEIEALEKRQEEIVTEMQNAGAGKFNKTFQQEGEELRAIELELQEKYTLWEQLEKKHSVAK